MKSQIKFTFNVGYNNDSSMGMSVFADEVLVTVFDQCTGPLLEFQIEITWPCKLNIVVSNKTPGDTTVDEHGNIVADKFIELKQILVDRMIIREDALHRLIELDTGDQKIKSLYWGFNGNIIIDMNKRSSFEWHLSQLLSEKNINLIGLPEHNVAHEKANRKILDTNK